MRQSPLCNLLYGIQFIFKATNDPLFWNWPKSTVSWPVIMRDTRLSRSTADEPQPWTDSRDCYFEYLIIHFDYLIIPFDYLIIGQNIANF